MLAFSAMSLIPAAVVCDCETASDIICMWRDRSRITLRAMCDVVLVAISTVFLFPTSHTFAVWGTGVSVYVCVSLCLGVRVCERTVCVRACVCLCVCVRSCICASVTRGPLLSRSPIDCEFSGSKCLMQSASENEPFIFPH